MRHTRPAAADDAARRPELCLHEASSGADRVRRTCSLRQPGHDCRRKGAARPTDDLGADSLDNVELVMAFEEEFGVEIPDDAAEHIQTVGDAIKFVEKATA